jgi:subtilisin-like proprotein convertase family protein
MKKITFTSLWLMLLGTLMMTDLMGQANVNIPFNTGPLSFSLAPPTACSFNFFDNGGPAGAYSNNSGVNSVATFLPSNAATHRVRVTFSAFATENNFDALYIFDGPSTASPLLPGGGGGTFGGFPAGGYMGGNSPGTKTAVGATGALTFQFRSDGSVTAAGWSSVVAQVPIAGCAMTAPANVTVSTGQFTCTADAVVSAPGFNPAGCNAALSLRYSVDGGMPIVLPNPIGPTVTLLGLTSGVHAIVWTLVDPCGNVVVATASSSVTVQDLVPPVITCPATINITLDPGACDAIVGYTVTATDNCPFLVPFVETQNPPSLNPMQAIDPAQSLNCGFAQTKFGRVFGGPTLPSTTITGLGVGIRAPGAGIHTYNIYRLTSGNAPAAGNANMQLIGGPFAINTPNVTAMYVPIVFGAPVSVPAGSYYFVEIITSGNFTMGNILAADLPGTPSYIAAAACGLPNYGTFASVGFANLSLAFNVVGFEGGEPNIMQTAGLPSGSVFPIGTTTNCFVVADVVGNTSTCCFDVIINEYPTPTTTLACNDNVQVSVNENCQAFIGTDMILEGGPYGCYDDYIVAVEGYGSGFGGVTIDNDAIGETLSVTVTDPETGNSCWGTISVEDKIPPTIECRDVVIMCGAQLPSEPAPGISGPQEIIIDGLNDIIDGGPNTPQIYDLDYGYLPAGTPVLDVNARINIQDHSWVPDLQIEVIAPSGQAQTVFQIGGCAAQNLNVNCWFDDEGLGTPGAGSTCDFFDGGAIADDYYILPYNLPGTQEQVLDNLDGTDASGVWQIRISDSFQGDDGLIMKVGLQIDVDLPAIVPADNCGEVTTTVTDTESGDPCEGLLVTRHWVVTDESGNTAACDQNVTVLPLVLDSVDCPPAYVGHCGDSSDPDITGWPSVNGNEITDEDNVCNIFVGYWDKPLNDCGNGEKIVRTWTVLDWCTQTTVECVQVIKLTDDEAPELECPNDFEVGTDFWYCYANVSVPKPSVFDACGSSYTLSLTAHAGIVVNFGNNYVINQLPLGDHTVTWTATDECGNSSSCSFVISVVDDVVPVANCDEHTVVSLTNDGPFGITLVPAHVFDDGSYDNCGPVTFRVRRMDSCIDFDWTTEGACIDDVPGGIPPVNSRDRGTVSRPCVPFACCDVGAGPIMVELEVTDLAGNRNYCMVEAIVQDKISPFVECPPDIIVSCDFWFNVQEDTFGDSPVDFEGNGNGNLDEDPLSAVFGNMYDAFAYNDDESVRQDIIINDPGNDDYSPQPHFWGIDGWADDNCEVNLSVRVRVIDDCSGGDLPGNAPEGAVKLIERRFSASDGNDGVAPGTCTQRIWVVDFDPFYITDNTCNNSNPQDGVIWPCDVLLTTCPEDLGNLGQPTLFDDACSLIGVTYEDTRFDFVDGACYKILRRWAVIDWCQYNSQTGEGLWYYTQVIKVHDEDGPEFVEPCETVTYCVADTGVSLPDNNQAFLGEDNPLASSCSVHLNFTRVVHETCSDIVQYDVKIYPYNGTDYILIKSTSNAEVDSSNNATLSFDTRQSTIQDIRLNGIPYNSQWCGDYHRILWSVEDGCGNWSHCEYLFRLEDCKQPSPVCINGLSTVVMPVGGQVTIWAKDFNASSFDDCTPEAELLYSFSGDTYEPSFTYTCDNVPAFGVELSTQIWVADNGTDDNCNNKIEWSERNKDYCTTTIVITDNAGVCGGGGSILAGEIFTEDVQAVELVGVSINAPGHVFPTYITATNGQYNFNNVVIPSEFNINAERNDAHKNGVSTLDLVKIQKHLLGIELMNSPYDLIAADANNSQNVSAIDLVELRKLILGIYTELPAQTGQKSWRFVDKSFQFADVTNPWPFSESIHMNGMTGSETDKDFVAIKVGDVNNTVQANALQVKPRGGNGVVNFVAENRTVSAGEMVAVAIRSADFTGIEGYQFTMQANGLEFRGVESGVVTMSDENMGVFGSTLTASWNNAGGVKATSSDVLFTLHFQATAAGQLSNMINLNSTVTEAEAYNTASDIKDLKLTFRGTEIGAEFALYQNEPNPFKGNTSIGYDLPAAGNVVLTVFDVTGKVVLVKEQVSVKGYNTITISSKEMSSVGVMYYRLDADEYTATKKMIIIE